METINKILNWIERNGVSLILILVIVFGVAASIVMLADLSRDAEIKREAAKIERSPNYLR